MTVVRDRLQDILDAIAQIETEQAKGRDAFLQERLIQVLDGPPPHDHQ